MTVNMLDEVAWPCGTTSARQQSIAGFMEVANTLFRNNASSPEGFGMT